MISKTASITSALVLLSCSPALLGQGPPPPLQPLGNPPVPAGNPITAAKTNLGKSLFWDEQLSSTRTISCGTCHQPVSGGSDPRSAVGDESATHPGPDGELGTTDDVTGSPGVAHNLANGAYGFDAFFGMNVQVTGRYAPSAINAAFVPELFWDGRAGETFVDPVSGETILAAGAALENQAAGPPVSGAEMGHQDRNWVEIASRIRGARPLALSPSIPTDLESWIAGRNYPALFDEAFGDEAVTPARIILAIATYERTLVSNQAPLDAFLAGNQNALTPQERQGMQLFGQNDCATCHRGNRFTDDNFHYIGVRPQTEDLGRFLVTGVNGDRGRMKTPTLRNASLRGEFMHNGSLSSLEEVVDFYDRGGDFDAPNKNNNVRPLGLTDAEKAALVAFLGRPLTDPRVAAETGPFSRPALFSGSIRQPAIGDDVIEDDEGKLPAMVAIEPAVGGNPNFTVGLHQAPDGRNVYLVLDTKPITTGEGVPDAEEVRMRFLLTTSGNDEGNGYASKAVAIPGGGSLDGVSLYGKWFITGDGEIFESASFETAVFGETAGALLPPQDFSASDDGSSSQVSLTWTPSDEADFYDIYRNGEDSFEGARLVGHEVPGDNGSFIDDDVAPESTYFYWIVAVNEHEASAPSVSETGSTFDLGGFTLTATDGTSTTETSLAWPSQAGAAAYRVLRGTVSTPGLMETLAEVGEATYSDSAGSAARTYYYRIVAVDGAGAFVANSEVDAGSRALAPAGSLAASYNDFRDRISLTWEASLEATGYRVYRGAFPSSPVLLATVASTAYDDFTSSPAREYTYHVIAFNEYGESTTSAVGTGYRAISPPTDVTAATGEDASSVLLTWMNAEAVSDYAIFHSTTDSFDDAVEIAVVSGLSSYRDGDAVPGETYYYWVASVDEGNLRVIDVTASAKGLAGDITPDLLIGRSMNSLKGDQVYNDNGAGQTFAKGTRRYHKLTIRVEAENDGSIEDVFQYSGSGGNRFFKYHYFRNSPSAANLTASVKAGVGVSGSVAPGADEDLLVRVVPIRSRQKSRNRTYRHVGYVRIGSNVDAAQSDRVKVKVKAKY